MKFNFFAIFRNFQIKILGFLISEKPNNYELIENERNKYRSYESFVYLQDELPYDIWSFGCMLIDLFASKEQVFKQKIKEDELRKMHEIEAFPIISDEITGFLREIILKCLERDPNKRIKIDELQESLTIYLKSITGDRKESIDNKDFQIEGKILFNKSEKLRAEGSYEIL